MEHFVADWTIAAIAICIAAIASTKFALGSTKLEQVTHKKQLKLLKEYISDLEGEIGAYKEDITSLKRKMARDQGMPVVKGMTDGKVADSDVGSLIHTIAPVVISKLPKWAKSFVTPDMIEGLIGVAKANPDQAKALISKFVPALPAPEAKKAAAPWSRI